MQRSLHPAPMLFMLVILTLLMFCVALAVGSVSLPVSQVLAALTGHGDPLTRTLILELRLPRTLTAFATGGLLALAGALMQVLLRNPLADPYVLGVSGGAAAGALGALLAGFGGYWLSGSAFVGALVSMLIVFVLAHGRGGWTPTRLLLTGIVVAFGWGAAVSFMLVLSDDASLRSMLFWLMGDLSYRGTSALPLVVLGLGLLAWLPFARHLNVLSRGETLAEALGIAVRPFSISIYIAASLFTAVAVTEAGAIGFVGLVVPHMLRLVSGSDHRSLLPGAVLAGGSLLMLADMLARTLLAPRQLPVGVLTAAIGVPLFLYLLNRARGPL
ncbi:MAG TPA: iron ABC transporter permease [Gammaproteobacteria bacterium]|nr:iron ABC transporter permease [Gammaproteobacteria bacterium]